MTTFRDDVMNGLSSKQKELPSKWIYNDVGDDLFLQVTKMPEYYLTASEKEIFQDQCQAMITSFKRETLTRNVDVIELGAGDGEKSILLLQNLLKQNNEHNIFKYIPIDISRHSLDILATKFKKEVPSISIYPEEGDYITALKNIRRTTNDWSTRNRIILFLGNSIGNMDGENAKTFISQLENFLLAGDLLVLGVDLIKPDTIILPAYSGPRNLRFKLNMLKRINDELGGNFDLCKFSNESTYTQQEGILRDYIKSAERQEVYIKDIDTAFQIEKDETIQIDISCKYDDERMCELINNERLPYVCKFTDTRNYFADYIYRVI